MRTTRSIRCVLAAVICGTLFNSAARADGETIAAFTKNQVDPHFEGVRAGVAQMAEKMRATVKYYTPTKPNNITEGMSQLEDVGVTKPNLMLFMPIDAKAQLPTIKRLIESGLPTAAATPPTSPSSARTITSSATTSPRPCSTISAARAMW